MVFGVLAFVVPPFSPSSPLLQAAIPTSNMAAKIRFIDFFYKNKDWPNSMLLNVLQVYAVTIGKIRYKKLKILQIIYYI
jgi:hypothetical protein